MIYRRKGDDGKTTTFDDAPGARMSKASALSEALGTMDELGSFLGLCKVACEKSGFALMGVPFDRLVHDIQRNLFIVQAELAGADKTMPAEKVGEIETFVDAAEKELPPIHTFFISGGTERAALFDTARTLARRAERRVVAVHESNERFVGEHTRAYLNRLSTLLYALARLSNHKSGITEQPPDYQ